MKEKRRKREKLIKRRERETAEGRMDKERTEKELHNGTYTTVHDADHQRDIFERILPLAGMPLNEQYASWLGANVQEANVLPPPTRLLHLIRMLGVRVPRLQNYPMCRIETLDITEGKGRGCVYASRRGEWKRVPLRDPAIEKPIHSTRTLAWFCWDFCD